MSTPIERIAGYACEVNEEQWRELVKAATELGMQHGCPHHSDCKIAQIESDGELVCLTDNYGEKLIPYRDFLAKLKGDEKWEPKNGEEVEVQYFPKEWDLAIYVGTYDNLYVCKGCFECGSYFGFEDARIRPLRPTITRAEAEHALGKRIVD